MANSRWQIANDLCWRGSVLRAVIGLLVTVLASSMAWGQSERSLVRDGNRAYTGKKYSDAEVSYRKALEKNKEMTTGVFNLGDALYKQERYDEAAQQYQIAASRAGDRKEKAAALHNLGNALLKNKKLEESLGAYKEALKLNPKDEDTKYNYEYAKTLLQQQQQQQKQNQNQKNQQNKDDKNKQDQQQQQQQKQDQQKQDQQKQDQQKQEQQQQQDQKQAQQRKPQISKQDAERILDALQNQEQNVQKKLHKVKVPARVRVEKDW